METCPKCGYCPQCGRSNAALPLLNGYTCLRCGRFVYNHEVHVCNVPNIKWTTTGQTAFPFKEDNGEVSTA